MNNSIIDKTEQKLKQPFESVGMLIITMRESYGWSQRDLAEKVPCTQSCVSSWETGRVLPNNNNLFRLAELFEMHVSEILLGMSCLTTAEQETPEQAGLTNQVLSDLVKVENAVKQGRSFVDLSKEPAYYGIPESELDPEFFKKHIVPESDQEVEERIGTYKGGDKPAFNLIFAGSELAHVRIVHRCHCIDVSPSDFPVLLIDLLSEKMRAE